MSVLSNAAFERISIGAREHTASIGWDVLGDYISEEQAKAAVERKIRNG